MKAEDENKPASQIAAEGEKVTGGSGEVSETETNESTRSSSTSENGGEVTTETETKKEEMNSYNELPDQAKVGGG